jgi:hypothetical protein
VPDLIMEIKQQNIYLQQQELQESHTHLPSCQTDQRMSD